MKIKDFARVQGGYAFKSDKFTNNEVPVIRIGNLDGTNVSTDNDICYTEEFWYEHPEFRINKGDILIAMSGATVGKTGRYLNESKALLNQRVCNLLPKENVDKDYLYYFCLSLSFKSQIQENAFGCAQPNISGKQIEEFEIKVPNMEEQKIAVKLLNKTSNVIDLRKQQLDEMDNLIKSRFNEMFGDPVANPMNWKVHRLGELSTQINSGNTPKGGEQVYVDDGIMFFRSQNVWKNRLDLEDIAYIDAKTHASMSRSSLKNGDILMTKTGRINTENSSLGRAALYLGEDNAANVNGHVYFIRLKPNVNNKFILRILVSDEYRDYIRSVCVGGIDKRQLNKSHIEDFPIIYPPIEMQNQYVKFVEHVDEQKNDIQNSLTELETLFKALMKKYFS